MGEEQTEPEAAARAANAWKWKSSEVVKRNIVATVLNLSG